MYQKRMNWKISVPHLLHSSFLSIRNEWTESLYWEGRCGLIGFWCIRNEWTESYTSLLLPQTLRISYQKRMNWKKYSQKTRLHLTYWYQKRMNWKIPSSCVSNWAVPWVSETNELKDRASFSLSLTISGCIRNEWTERIFITHLLLMSPK